jgi:GT2 family glycosyltransferase
MSGYCVGIPIEVIKAIGVPDQNRFPHYYGDCTYILKANRFGFPAYILGDVKVGHQGSQLSIADHVTRLNFQHSIFKTFEEIFLNKKSAFFLKSQYFYCLEKYGAVRGISLFLIKTNVRIFTMISQMRNQSKP